MNLKIQRIKEILMDNEGYFGDHDAKAFRQVTNALVYIHELERADDLENTKQSIQVTIERITKEISMTWEHEALTKNNKDDLIKMIIEERIRHEQLITEVVKMQNETYQALIDLANKVKYSLIEKNYE